MGLLNYFKEKKLRQQIEIIERQELEKNRFQAELLARKEQEAIRQHDELQKQFKEDAKRRFLEICEDAELDRINRIKKMELDRRKRQEQYESQKHLEEIKKNKEEAPRKRSELALLQQAELIRQKELKHRKWVKDTSLELQRLTIILAKIAEVKKLEAIKKQVVMAKLIEVELREKEEQAKVYKEEKELAWAIKEEKKDARKNRLGVDPIRNKGYCNFLAFEYCAKYDFSPAMCGPNSNEYGCSWRERRIADSYIKYNEEICSTDIQDEKKLTMFGEFYHDKDKFNVENYEDMLDFYDWQSNHSSDE